MGVAIIIQLKIYFYSILSIIIHVEFCKIMMYNILKIRNWR